MVYVIIMLNIEAEKKREAGVFGKLSTGVIPGKNIIPANELFAFTAISLASLGIATVTEKSIAESVLPLKA